VILRNEWATGAVFAVVNDETVKARWGRFDLSDSERIWSDAYYTNRHPELRALLQKFEFCYQLTDTEPQWLVPQLLPPERPESLDGWAQPGDLALVYHYDFLPRGIISRLIVRENRYVTDLCQVWRAGALLTREDTELLVDVSPNDNDIMLRSRGPQSKELLSAVAADLDELNGTYGNLRSDNRVHLRIPCICQGCTSEITPHFYDHRELLDRKHNPNAPDTVNCSKHYHDVAVIELLDGIHLPTHAATDDRPDPTGNRYPAGQAPIHAPGSVVQVFNGDTSKTTAIGTSETTVVNPPSPKKADQSQSDGWNRVALVAGLVAAGVAVLLILAPSAWWRFTIATIGGSGFLAWLFVLVRNPKRFYRRLLYRWISLGIASNWAGFLIDGVITRNDAQVNFTFSNDLAWWWWSIWALITVALIRADHRSSDRE
jgi:hypothetical protein